MVKRNMLDRWYRSAFFMLIAAAVFIFGSFFLLMRTETPRLETKIDSPEVRLEIQRALGESSWDAEQFAYILMVGKRPSDEDFERLEKELDAAEKALARWRKLENR